MSWTLRCLKPKCGRTFNADSSAAKCPTCKGKRTRWIPSGIAIGGKGKVVDQATRQLATDFGMTDIRSPEYGLAAKRIAEPAKTFNYEPVPGWKVPIPIDGNGHAAAACAPTGQTVKIRPSDGSVGRTTLPGPKPQLAAAPYRPAGGLPK